eukprot:349607_1
MAMSKGGHSELLVHTGTKLLNEQTEMENENSNESNISNEIINTNHLRTCINNNQHVQIIYKYILYYYQKKTSEDIYITYKSVYELLVKKTLNHLQSRVKYLNRSNYIRIRIWIYTL